MCCWLKVPGRETAGGGHDRWTYDQTSAAIDAELKGGAQLVFPLATLVETGNHITHAPHDTYQAAERLSELLRKAIEGAAPWIPFAEQSTTISGDGLMEIVENWKNEAARGISIGDFLIQKVADYYSIASFEVKILSSDYHLRQYQPKKPPREPRRRQRR